MSETHIDDRRSRRREALRAFAVLAGFAGGAAVLGWLVDSVAMVALGGVAAALFAVLAVIAAAWPALSRLAVLAWTKPLFDAPPADEDDFDWLEQSNRRQEDDYVIGGILGMPASEYYWGYSPRAIRARMANFEDED